MWWFKRKCLQIIWYFLLQKAELDAFPSEYGLGLLILFSWLEYIRYQGTRFSIFGYKKTVISNQVGYFSLLESSILGETSCFIMKTFKQLMKKTCWWVIEITCQQPSGNSDGQTPQEWPWQLIIPEASLQKAWFPDQEPLFYGRPWGKAPPCGFSDPQKLWDIKCSLF